MDIPDINLVVQFMVASLLSVLMQHFGRAGRSGQPAIAILLAKPSVFQVKKKNNATKATTVAVTVSEPNNIVKDEPMNDNSMDQALTDTLGLDDEDPATEYRKKTESGMQDWCLTLGCRWDISNKYFNNSSPLKSA